MSDGATISRRDEEIVQGLSEAILANVLAMHQAGIRTSELKMVVGPDGGTVPGGGVMLQTPGTRRLPDPLARKLLERFRQLLDDLDAGLIPAERLARIGEGHNVPKKVLMILGEPDGGAQA